MKKIIQYIYRSAFFPFMPFKVIKKWENEGYGINPFLLSIFWLVIISFGIVCFTKFIFIN